MRIGVITALPKEFAAMVGMLGCNECPPLYSSDGKRTYKLAMVHPKNGTAYVVAVTLLADMGNNIASISATNFILDCPHVEYLIMTGIAGAVPYPEKPADHVRLGDIVISGRDGVIQYDNDKETLNTITIRHPPRPPARFLLDAVQRLQADEIIDIFPWEAKLNDFCLNFGAKWHRPEDDEDRLEDDLKSGLITPHPKDPNRRLGKPRIFVAPIASANKLLKNPKKRNQIRDKFRIKAVEMEGSGIADASWHGEVGYLVIRGTCDYCNPTKGDSWQFYAASIAAAYTCALLEILNFPSNNNITPPPISSNIDQTSIVSNGISNSYSFNANANAINIQNSNIAISSYDHHSTDLIELLQKLHSKVDAFGLDPSQSKPTLEVAQAISHMKNQLDELKTLLYNLEYFHAFQLAKDMDAFLLANRSKLPDDVIVNCLLALCEAETIKARVAKQSGLHFDTKKAEYYLNEARNAKRL